MKIPARLPAAISAALLLTGCGQYLGAYTVESVRVATDVPLPAETSSHYGQFLEIRLSSETNITAFADEIDAVYVDADFCPLRNEHGLIAFGPFSDDRENLGSQSTVRAVRPGIGGRIYYRIYVPVAYRAQPATQPGQFQLPTYDIRHADRDLCLRLFAPGYNLIKSRSAPIRVPANMISTALNRHTAASRRR